MTTTPSSTSPKKEKKKKKKQSSTAMEDVELPFSPVPISTTQQATSKPQEPIQESDVEIPKSKAKPTTTLSPKRKKEKPQSSTPTTTMPKDDSEGPSALPLPKQESTVATTTHGPIEDSDLSSTPEEHGTKSTTTTTLTTTTPVRWLPTFTALCRKNWLLTRAAKWQLLICFALPLAAMGLTYTMQRVAENFVEDWLDDNDSDSAAVAKLHILTSPATQAVQPCAWYDVYNIHATQECATILYAPYAPQDVPAVDQIMQYVAEEAKLPIVPAADTTTTTTNSNMDYLDSNVWSGGTIVGVPSVQDVGEFLVTHPGRAQAVLYFASPLTTTNDGNTTLSPLIYFRYNLTKDDVGSYHGNNENRKLQSNQVRIPMALQRAVMALYHNKTQINIRIAKRNMFANPQAAAKQQEQQTSSFQNNENIDEGKQQELQRQQDLLQVSTEVVSYLLGPILIFAICMSCALLANHAAAEKTSGLIGSLRVVGMADSAYWASWWTVQVVVVVIPASGLMVALAYALDIALITQVNAIVLLVTLIVQYSAILALHFAAVAIATNRPFLYALYFCLLCLCVTSVALAPVFQAGPGDRVGKAFGYAVPGYHLGGVLDSMYRFNTRTDYSLEAAQSGNFSNYDWDQFWQPFGRCNATLWEESEGTVCQNVPLWDEPTCWRDIDCEGIPEDQIWNSDYCAPQSCYFYPMADATRVLVMLGQTVVWMILAWYFMQIVPSGNGLTYLPWCVLQPKFWFGGAISTRTTAANMSREQQQSQKNGSIVLQGLTKRFKGNTAVNNVDMNIQNGQVFVLLGHNGAGKSTLVNMLTGKLAPTSGEAYVMGMSIKDNVHGIQRLVSCVPQHDLLWGELSAMEHIRLFAQIKGVARQDLAREVDKVLHRVHLMEAAKQPAGGYSGGMKRRLSIALAGIGGPKVIMLDEPTTGIDPLNRRRIWNSVRELKRDRIVVLTTHLMQEADCLGDQIAVLDNGTIQAQGTPLNLKTEHGSGYSLSIVTDVAYVERVKSLAREMMPNVELVNEAAGSLAFGVHADELAAIPTLTRQLQSEGMIREWNISQSTIEEVFLRLASQSTAMQNRQQQMQNTTSLGPSGVAGGGIDGHNDGTELESNLADVDQESGGMACDSDVFAPAGSCWRLQLAALLRKAFILRRRHWIATLVQLAIPIALVFVAKKFFFKDMKVNPWEVLVWPQATTNNNDFSYVSLVDETNQCAFEWNIWSTAFEGRVNRLETLTNAESAAKSIEYPEAYGAASRMSFQVSGVSSLTPIDVQDAFSEAMRYYLTRASSEDTQDEADASCQFGDCGACMVSQFQVREINADRVEYFIEEAGGFGDIHQCQTTYTSCGLDVYKVMLRDPTFSERLSQRLNSPVKVENLQIHAQSTVSMASLFRSPSVEASISEDEGRPYGYCDSCRESTPHFWLSGQNAQLFERSLEGVAADFTSDVVSSSILGTLSKNRESLEASATSFLGSGPFDVSACATIGSRDYGYGDYTDGRLRNIEGFIVNSGNFQAWPENNAQSDFPYDERINGAMCNATIDPLAHYREMFPDAAITLTSFEVGNDSITLDLVWEVDVDNYYYEHFGSDLDTFGPSKQSVYALYCSPDQADEQGRCTEEADLTCVRAVPYSGCDGYSYGIPNDSLVDATYRALWGASGSENESPLIQAVPDAADVWYEAAVNLDELALFVFMIAVAIALYAPNVASVLVFEKNQRFIFAMLLNGLKIHVYWTAQYLSHLVTTGLLGAVTIILGVALQLKPFASQNPNAGLLLVVLLSGIHAQFGFIVLLSSFFKKERFAAVLVGFMVLMTLGAAILTHLASQDKLKSRWPAAFSLIPSFGFFRCLLLVVWKRYYDELWAHIGVMLGSSTLYLMLGIYWQTSTGVGALFKWDCGLFSHLFGSHGNPALPPAEADEDDEDLAEADIAHEEHRALKLSPSDTAIKITHLGKTFPARPNPKHAVTDVTMAMDYGEIFGLLGPNGAGKTTVISMLVGQLSPSRGHAFVAGYDTVEERRAALSKLGIVPQFDVYYPELTVREHLMLYAAMKGVKPLKQDPWAKSIAATVGLGGEDLFNRQASALSGGMRRRLSIAVALLSKPSCLFLDEPTTGLDPEMKRSIWNIIERMRQDRCVILTTHAMDEAEALCSRIGIMAKGSLKCIGTQKELRERYGSTYELTFTVPKGTTKTNEALKKYLLGHCPSTSLVSNFGETRVFTVDKSDMELADLFEVIVHARKEDLYTEWGINNTSLDEVFIAITAESEGVGAGEL